MDAKLGFGERIKQVMRERASGLRRDYGNKEFGEEIGVAARGKPYTPQAVTEWIAERSEPNIRAFRAMAKITGKSIPWLMAVDDIEGNVRVGANERYAQAMTDEARKYPPAPIEDPPMRPATRGSKTDATPIRREGEARGRRGK